MKAPPGNRGRFLFGTLSGTDGLLMSDPVARGAMRFGLCIQRMTGRPAHLLFAVK